jgi:F0F1-type ATP synthase assembly protein I
MARNGAAGKDGTEAPVKQGPLTRLRTTFGQMRTVYSMTRKGDPTALWVMLAGGLAVVGAMVGIGYLIGHPLYFLILGVPLGVMAALVIMARRAEKVAYSHIQGQAGASLAALRNLRRGWNVEQYPVAVDPRTQDVVFRALGRPGIVLITEGPLPRVGKLAEQERKKHARLLPNVPITVINSGEGEGMVELRRLSPTVMKLKPALTKDEVTEVSKRLRAMGGAKPAIPKGVDPLRARPDRKASRGR